MANEKLVFQLTTKPGIQRDGTDLDTNIYNDGQWVRFYRGRPKKMAGYREITADMAGPCRKALVWSRGDPNSIYNFSQNKIEMLLVDANGVGNAIIDRTPVAFTGTDKTTWQVDTQYDDAVGSQGTVVLAHASSSLHNIDDTTASKPYLGLALDNGVFTEITGAPAVSGGVFSVAPYTIAHGSDGYIAWSDANQPQVWNSGDAGSDRITGAKIVKGLPIRSGTGLAALLWSLDSVLRMDYIGGSAIWRFSTLSTQSSILSQNSVIEYDGTFFWVGIDRFMYFDTSVKELPNTQSLNYFFDNLNFAQRQKVWAMKVPRFGEIWWFYPRGEATECTHAVIFNIKEKTWYDVELGRSAGFYSQVFHYPVMMGSEADTSGDYSVWLHEFGVDRIKGEQQVAIPSYFETSDFGYPTGSVIDDFKGLDRWTRLTRIEPDFVQSGIMTVTVTGKEFAQTPIKSSAPYVFTPTTGKIDMREQRREIRVKFESNEAGGNYEAGKIILHIEPGDVRS